MNYDSVMFPNTCLAPGDRSHIPPSSLPVFESLNTEMQRIKAKAPKTYLPQVLDTEKRLDWLFDHLNNQEVLKPDTIEQLKQLSQSVQDRQHEAATAILQNIMTTKVDEGSNWMVSKLLS
jgi:protein transport protein SEC31